mgnify:CR=1 FL=1
MDLEEEIFEKKPIKEKKPKKVLSEAQKEALAKGRARVAEKRAAAAAEKVNESKRARDSNKTVRE